MIANPNKLDLMGFIYCISFREIYQNKVRPLYPLLSFLQGANDCITSGKQKDKNVWFELQYQEQKVLLRIGDKCVSMRPNGQLLAIPKAAGTRWERK